MRRIDSIYFRLVMPLGAAMLLAMLAAWIIAIQVLTNAMDRRLDDQLTHATAILADGEFPFSPEIIGRVDRLIEARIALLDESGVVRLSTSTDQANEALAMLAQRLPDMHDGEPLLLTGQSSGSSWRIAVRPLPRTRDARFHYVAAAGSLAEARQAAWDAALLLGAAILFAAVLLAWFGNYFTRSITRPVSDLAKMADRIADGERDVSSTFTADNEIGLLARALNEMTSRLTQYEAEIERQGRQSGLGDLAARLAHEIRNPLTAIKMQLQLLQENVPDSDAPRVTTLLSEIRRMELMVDSALTLAAPQALRRVNVRLETVVTELAELLRPSLSHRNIELQIAIDRSPEIYADPDRVKQVLLNLINNAADELVDGGIIRISVHSIDTDGSLEICVEDSGPGLQAGEDGNERKKPFGLGLGLTICREIVEQHGGQLLSDGPGDLGGARFTIRLQMPVIEHTGQAG
jgi:signal transduction histidine kinase